MMEERREYSRFKTFLEGEVEPETGTGLTYKMQLIDFSRQGLRIFVPKIDFPKTDLLKLRVYSPDSDLPVFIRGAVRWIQPKEDGCEIGAKIDQVDAADKSKILNYAYNIWKEKKTEIK